MGVAAGAGASVIEWILRPDGSHCVDTHGYRGCVHDPLAAHDDGHHAGVALLRDAAEALDAGQAEIAAALAQRARAIGVPAELAPYLAVVGGTSLLLARRIDDARGWLEQAWSEHPDVAALPAVLGAVHQAAGHSGDASRTMFAALVSDDPDGSLATHRRRLTQLLRVVDDRS